MYVCMSQFGYVLGDSQNHRDLRKQGRYESRVGITFDTSKDPGVPRAKTDDEGVPRREINEQL